MTTTQTNDSTTMTPTDQNSADAAVRMIERNAGSFHVKIRDVVQPITSFTELFIGRGPYETRYFGTAEDIPAIIESLQAAYDDWSSQGSSLLHPAFPGVMEQLDALTIRPESEHDR